MTVSERREAQPVSRGLRDDIQGLRALAVIGVILFHLGATSIPGGFIGVDIFFVISGYLVGGALLREIQLTGRIRFAEFWAKRARRILPASLLVTTVTMLASATVFSSLRFSTGATDSITNDAIATLLYVPNLWFGIQGNDYLADTSQSPFLHYWSLGVEEQFYVVVPLLLLAVWVVTRRRWRTFVTTLAALSLASLVISQWIVSTDAVAAFYNPVSRAWELSAGMLVAIVPRVGHAWTRRVAAIVGVAGLVTAMFLLPTSPQWPNGATVAVVLATAAALWGGSSTARPESRHPATRVLSAVGDRSYSLYLWHWPVILILIEVQGHALGVRSSLAALSITAVLAELSYRFVETPLRRLPVTNSRQRRQVWAMSIGGTLVAASVVAAIAISNMPEASSSDPLTPVSEPTAVATAPPEFASTLPEHLRPSLAEAKEDVPANYNEVCHVPIDGRAEPLEPCVYGEGGLEVALFGDSHVAQWLPSLEPAISENKVRVVSLTASWCQPMQEVRYPGDHYDNCDQWRTQAIEYLVESPPDLIVVSSFLSHAALAEDPTGRATAQAVESTLATLAPTTRVVWVADTAEFPDDPQHCITDNPDALDECAISYEGSRAAALDRAVEDASAARGVEYLDLNDIICSPSTCGVITGDTLIYRDYHHLSATFARSLSATFEARLGLE